MKDEVDGYISEAYQKEQEALLRDVYVTNHEPRDKKYLTVSDQEDQDFYKYKKSLEEYTNDVKPRVMKKTERYERGSLLQRVFEPFAGARRLENSALFYKFEDKEVESVLQNEEKLRAEFERLTSNDEVWEVAEEDEDAMRASLLDEFARNSDFNIEEFEDILARELSVFKTGEKYDYVTDMKRAYSESLAQTSASKIFDTLPDHVFWDIKKPITGTD
jgi:hypothetical protein